MAQKRPLIGDRHQYCRDRIDKIRHKVSELSESALKAPGLCIYVTGSYGRFEASPHSDLDLFFIQDVQSDKESISKIEKTLIDAALIKIGREMGFPEFSGDGRYLEIHSINDILKELGGPADDYFNYFTARMLLLLESNWVHNPNTYKNISEKVTDSYYRDYHDHQGDFKPLFLVNDIIRFWKTLCLNYEHKRNRPKDQPDAKNKAHLKNLKLKFSRMLTCYSMIIRLTSDTVTCPEQIVTAATLPPLTRLEQVGERHKCAEIVSDIKECYSWFLETTGKMNKDVLHWISIESNRNAAFLQARKFGNKMFDLLLRTCQENVLRYVVI